MCWLKNVDRMCWFAFRLCGQEGDAEDDAKDLVQEMYLNAFRGLKAGQVEVPPSHATRTDSRPLMTIPFWQYRIIA